MSNSGHRKFLADQAGAIAVLTALLIPIVIGGFGLGAEVSYWYFNQRKLQNAADVAAYAGAVQLRSNGDQQTIVGAALAAAVKAGYKATIGTITLNSPAATGAFAGDPKAVEITVQETLPTLFTSLFMDGDVPMAGRAVARLTEGQGTCILALDPDLPGAVTFTGSSTAILIGCNVHANSLASDAITVSGSAHVETPCVSTVGNVSATSGLVMSECTSPIEHADTIDDPYASVPEPGTGEPCVVPKLMSNPGDTDSVSPGRYCGGWKNIGGTLDMAPGVYVIDCEGTPACGLELLASAEVTGTGVIFYLINGAQIKINGGATVQVSAPTGGDYVGILFFVGRGEDEETPYIINGNSSSFYTGAIYAPNGQIELNGNSSSLSAGCTQVVARAVSLSGNNGMSTNCAGTGIPGIKTEQLVTLVE